MGGGGRINEREAEPPQYVTRVEEGDLCRSLGRRKFLTLPVTFNRQSKATLQNNGTDLSLTAVCFAVGDDSHVKMNTHNTIRAMRK